MIQRQGQEVSYLREVSNRISLQNVKLKDCFMALSFLSEELEGTLDKWYLDKEGERLAVSSYTIRSIFSQTMRSYNTTENLRQAQRKALEAEKGDDH